MQNSLTNHPEGVKRNPSRNNTKISNESDKYIKEDLNEANRFEEKRHQDKVNLESNRAPGAPGPETSESEVNLNHVSQEGHGMKSREN